VTWEGWGRYESSGYKFVFSGTLTDILRVDHCSFSVVLEDHVFLGQLQVEVRPSLLVTAENRSVNREARSEVNCGFFIFLALQLLSSI